MTTSPLNDTSPLLFTYLSDICAPIPLSLAVLSFPLNSLVVVIIATQIRQRAGKAHQGQIHLLFLAISDITVGLWFVSGAAWLAALRGRRLEASFERRYHLWFGYIVFTTCVNRLLTMYITIKRTQCVMNLDAAERMRSQSPRRHVIDTLIFGVAPGVILYAALRPAPSILVYFGAISTSQAEVYFWGVSVVFFALVAVAMGIMGSAIVIKVRSTSWSRSGVEIRLPADDFRDLVVAVAFVYVFCQFPMMVECAFMTTGVSAGDWIKSLNYTALMVNSTFNLVLYFGFSTKFRHTLTGLVREVSGLKGEEAEEGGTVGEEGRTAEEAEEASMEIETFGDGRLRVSLV